MLKPVRQYDDKATHSRLRNICRIGQNMYFPALRYSDTADTRSVLTETENYIAELHCTCELFC